MLADIRRPRFDKILKESYQNGTSWYRVYSDGWCEQGGELYSNKSQSYFTITFLKTMLNTKYNIAFVAGRLNEGTGNAYEGCFDYSSLSTSSMKLRADNDTIYVRWRIAGYIA